MRYIILLVCSFFLTSCNQEKTMSAQEIIDTALIKSGTNKLSNATMSFKFRNRAYTATRNNGSFSLERVTKKANELIYDKLTNNGFERFVNSEQITVPDSMATKYSGSVNSVHYFSVLPYGLNDAAVQKKLLPEATINSEKYYKVQISFLQEGGGEDYDDVFVYWFHKETFQLRYLAYSYHVNGGGMRFRKAVNERIINGIRIVDYINYKPTNASTKLENLDKAFENSELLKISEINLEDIQIELIH